MAKKPQAAVLPRRTPRQPRAGATIEAIFEATARIIEREGIAALNTNHIAERTGIGIGTLNEYFPNTEAVLIAMARRRLAEDARNVRQAPAMEDPRHRWYALSVRPSRSARCSGARRSSRTSRSGWSKATCPDCAASPKQGQRARGGNDAIAPPGVDATGTPAWPRHW
jgi:AcrR family transcriptional regulator